MAETLRQKQSRFVKMFAELVSWAYFMGYEMTFGEAKRSDEQAEINAMGSSGRANLAALLRMDGYHVLADKIANNTGSGIRGSLHEIGLAVDMNLFRDGKFLSSTEDHRPIGEKWKSMGGTWGGDFNDGNHYSLAHEGRK